MQDGGFVIGRKRGLAPLNQDTSMSMGGREIERSRDREIERLRDREIERSRI